MRGNFSLKIKPKAKHAASSPPKRIDVSKLKSNDIAVSFRAKIGDLMPLDPNNTWLDFKEKVYSTSANVLGFVKRKHQDWFDDNDEIIISLLDDKRKLFKKTLLPHQSQADKTDDILALKLAKSEIQKRLRVLKNSMVGILKLVSCKLHQTPRTPKKSTTS